MSTYITVTSGTGALVNRVKQVQQANREAQLQRENDTALQAQATADVAQQAAQTQRPIGGNPDTSIDRRPAAQRELGSVMGVEYTTQTIAGSPPTFRLTVGPPGQLVTTRAETAEPSTDGPSSQPSSSSTSSGPESVLGFLVLYSPPDFFGNTWRTEYPCGYTFQTGKGTAPTSSYTEDREPYVVTESHDDSAHYLLPLGNGTCIFVYVFSKLRTLTVYERRDRTDRVSVNARPTSSGCGGQVGTYYDRESTFLSENIFSHVEQRQAYQLMAFLVSPTTVRPISVPAQLDPMLRALHPPMAINDTAEVQNSSTYTRYEYADVAFSSSEPSNYNGPITYGTITIPVFSWGKHRESSRHGDYPYGNDVLAKQFGMGDLNTDSHSGDYFTPAVYRFIAAAMDLSSAAAQSYEYMRANFYALAPRKYLAPCVVEGSCPVDGNDEPTTVVFDTTTSPPLNTSTAMDIDRFRRGRKYKVPLNGTTQGAVTYGWDWDDPSTCQQTLLNLGFTPADLRP